MKYKKTIVAIASIVLVVMIGCSALMDGVTPSFIEPDIIGDVNEPPTSFMPFTTLWDAERMLNKFDYLYQISQLNLARQIENNKIRYAFLKDLQTVHIKDSRQFQETVFSPEGPIGLMLPTLLGGTLGAFLIKRPGDKSKKEVETEEKIRNGNNAKV